MNEEIATAANTVTAGFIMLTFAAVDLGSELQSLDVYGADVLQGDGELLRLPIEKLDGHGAGQLLFGHGLRAVSRPGPEWTEKKSRVHI